MRLRMCAPERTYDMIVTELMTARMLRREDR